MANSGGAKSLMDSGDLDNRLEDAAAAVGMLEEALTASGDHISLLFFRRLDRLDEGSSFSSMKVTRDFKKLLLASNRDIFLCTLPGETHPVSQTKRSKLPRREQGFKGFRITTSPLPTPRSRDTLRCRITMRVQ